MRLTCGCSSPASRSTVTSPIRSWVRSLRALPCPPIGHDVVDVGEQLVEIGPPSPGPQLSERGGRRIGIGHGHDSCGRGGVEHAEVPVLAGRRPRLGVEDEVIVGELDRAGPPPCERVADHDFELADRSLAVVAADPRVGGGVERVGVVGEVGRVDPLRRGSMPRRRGRADRRRDRAPGSRRSRRGRADRGRRRRHPRWRLRWFPCGGHSGASRQKSRRSSGASPRGGRAPRRAPTRSSPSTCAPES